MSLESEEERELSFTVCTWNDHFEIYCTALGEAAARSDLEASVYCRNCVKKIQIPTRESKVGSTTKVGFHYCHKSSGKALGDFPVAEKYFKT